MIEFTMPSLGADMEDGTLIEWRIQPGDSVKRGDIIAEVDTQKGLIEIEVFDEGIIDQICIQEGEKVPVGTVMATIIGVGEERVEIREVESPVKTITRKRRPKISPIAKKLAKELGVDPSTITGTGPRGSIVKKDIERVAGVKSISHLQEKREKRIPASEGMRSAIALAMSRSNREIPHFYLETRIDMSAALDWLNKTNKEREVKDRLLAVVLYIRAMAKAIRKVPEVNAYWENGLLLKDEVHIGFAISMRRGGVVIPAIRDADKKSLSEIMDILTDLIPRARAQKLRSSELSDSTITLSNAGEGTVHRLLGVVYPPQVAIVGFGSIVEEAWAENGTLSARPVVHVVLSADHRAIDGYLGGRFLTSLKNNLQNPASL